MARAAALLVAAVGLSACVTVDGLLAEGRLLEACRLADDHARERVGDRVDLDPPEGDEPDDAAVAAAVAALVRARLEPVDRAEQTALLGEEPRHAIALAWLELQAPAPLLLHELRSGGLRDDGDAAAAIGLALPPLDLPARPSLPPGPLEMPPPAPPPSPPARPRSRGFIDSMFELATLPFTIAGEVGKALVTIPLDLFGLRGTSSSSPSSPSSSSSPMDAGPRDAGEAILPPDAWAAERDRRLAIHAEQVAAVEVARETRRARLVRIADALRARCVVGGPTCRRLVVLDDGPADGVASTSLHFRAGIHDEGGACPVRREVRVDIPTPTRSTTSKVEAAPQPEVVPSPTTTPALTATSAEVPALAAAVAAARMRTTTTRADAGLDAVACRVEVGPAWRSLARRGELRVRIAAGTTAARGATVIVPAAPGVVVGAAVPLQPGDHLKVAVSGDDGWIGGAVVAFDGSLPITLDGGSVIATCR